ncbi:CPBP family glutamic-type intramembrane protease [Aurantiacibacter sp. MUD61]|uniref:CPBP family glutamic-type intramembrane protease n=1 Tax=Aurantiacibacter sp. MUD61 TaxID=3009083 RepID=UPI0022F075FC|nr:CPBP family glutamic-type intramembrane protease [Aurantiacibacter sp. MUD61]
MLKKSLAIAVILFGLVAWYAVVIATDFALTNVLEIDGGWRYATLGLVEFFLGGAIILLALRMAGLGPKEVGFTTHKLAADLAVGLLIAILFAALQILVLIPATGGATRSDVVANSAQLGTELSTLAGVLTLGLFGSTAEELLFRGLLLGGLASTFGSAFFARMFATIFVVVLFALSHGYQGWAGIIDTGLYGGLTLSLLYWWRGGRLAAPIAAHVGWNVIAAIWLFFFV